MKQYFGVKEKYPGAILLFRVGDFYETFSTDAVTASQVLGIILTKRNNEEKILNWQDFLIIRWILTSHVW